MTEDVTSAPSELSPDETSTALYLLALSIARQNGSVITTGARGLGPYVFMAEARRMGTVQSQPSKEHTMESRTEPFEFISL